MLTNGQYGFHRDELQFLSDAQHLDWGFVPYPPLTSALELLAFKTFGLSLVGLRSFSVLAQALVILISGLMARDLGGGRLAQLFAAIAVGLSPAPMANATMFQYSSFDMLWWVLVAWSVIRLLCDDDPRWWVAIGLFAGLGLQTKYSIAFELLGVLADVLLTDARRYLTSRWLWIGGAVALLAFAPNLIWLVSHDFISYRFLQSIHARDVNEGRADGFLRDQFLINANLFAAPVWIAGLVGYLREASPHARLDVRRAPAVVHAYAGPLLLCQRGLSDAACHGIRHRRAVAAHPPSCMANRDSNTAIQRCRSYRYLRSADRYADGIKWSAAGLRAEQEQRPA
jgi:4-amino-4-deoxy-L-arabinose transferase-like glycosyltransferase